MFSTKKKLFGSSLVPVEPELAVVEWKSIVWSEVERWKNEWMVIWGALKLHRHNKNLVVRKTHPFRPPDILNPFKWLDAFLFLYYLRYAMIFGREVKLMNEWIVLLRKASHQKRLFCQILWHFYVREGLKESLKVMLL